MKTKSNTKMLTSCWPAPSRHVKMRNRPCQYLCRKERVVCVCVRRRAERERRLEGGARCVPHEAHHTQHTQHAQYAKVGEVDAVVARIGRSPEHCCGRIEDGDGNDAGVEDIPALLLCVKEEGGLVREAG